MASSFIDSRWRAMLSIFIVVGWVNVFFNLLAALAFLVLTPPHGGQQALLKIIGALMLALAAAQAAINFGLNRREEWARRAAWGIAFLEFFQPPFGTVHAVMAYALLRRPSALQWFA